MDRFYFPAPRAWLCAAALAIPAAWAAPRELPAPGVIVQLRPGVVSLDTEPVVAASVVAREAPQALRERAQAVWQRQHDRRAEHLGRVAQDAGVGVARVGSAGSALRLDFVQDLTGEPLEAAMRRLRLHPDVLSVTPNARWQRQQTTVPNDPQFAQQWHLQAPTTAVASALNLSAAWGLNTGTGSPIVVAVVDSGVRYDHPDLGGHLLPGYDFVSEVEYSNDGNGRDADASDPGDWVTRAEARTALFSGCRAEDSNWHGTGIAGLIAAATNNGLGVAGVHWGAQVLPVRVAGKCGAVVSDLLDGMRWAGGLAVAGVPTNPNPARIINLSYGGSGACDSAYQQTIDDLTAAGVLVVVAAGNEAEPLTRPADCRGVLAVAAVRGDGAKTYYSNYGTNVALAVPGGSGAIGSEDVGLLTTYNAGTTVPMSHTYENLSGTSFAAPLAAGTAALMLSVQPRLTAGDLTTLLKQSVRPHVQVVATPELSNCNAQAPTQGVCNCTDSTCGAGMLDVRMALVAAAQAVPSSSTTVATTSTTTSGGGGHTGWAWGLALWAWLALVALTRRRLAR